jgi:hypothetical protein
MAKYLNPDQYRKIVKSMPLKEIEGLLETFTTHKASLSKEEFAIARILDMEMERRIANWEAVQV